jgi:hypothetical protein
MHYYEKNIVDIKTEYSEFMLDVISPLIYEGIQSMYIKAMKIEKEYAELCKTNIKIKNPGSLKIFQHFLKNVPTLNINLIESELIRIRDNSGHADIFERLIKAVFKCYIILLTYNASGKQCKLVNEKFHDKIDLKQFIHKIYIESAKQLFNVPHLFYHNVSESELKKNELDSINIIRKSILDAVRNMLPMNEILTEYLKNDYILETEIDKKERVRKMIINNEEDNIFGGYFNEDNMKIVNTEEDNNISKNLNDLNKLIGGQNQDINIQNELNIDNINNQEGFNNPIQEVDNNENDNNNDDNNGPVINVELGGGKKSENNFNELLSKSKLTSKISGVINNLENQNNIQENPINKDGDDREFINAIFN